MMNAGGIVLYNPSKKRLKENIDAVLGQVDFLVLADNGSKNHDEIRTLLGEYENIVLIENSQNRGIAAALNQIVLCAKQKGADWVLMLDQDSVCQPGLVEHYERYKETDRVGMMTCKIIDRNINRSFEVGKREEENYEIQDVERCITSGSFMKIEACIQSGMFDEPMFIDYVDYDMCFSMRESGYRIIKCNFDGLLHELGNTVVKKVLGVEFIVTNHGPLRRYYFSRNIIYCLRKHKGTMPKWKFLYKNYIRILIALLYEDQKWEKLKSAVRGIKDGYRMPVTSKSQEK
mgnify:FL=1